MPSSSNRSLRRLVVLVGGVAALASIAGASFGARELPARRTIGSQARVEEHRRASLDHAQDSVRRCVDALPIDPRRCNAEDDERDRDFFHAMPHRR